MTDTWIITTSCESFPNTLEMWRADLILGTYVTINRDIVDRILGSPKAKRFKCEKKVVSPAELVMDPNEFILIYAKDINDLDFFILISCLSGDYVLVAVGPEPLCREIEKEVKVLLSLIHI